MLKLLFREANTRQSVMQITEIYKSLQGESTHAGLPCLFVRLTGCNLRCSWCDSEYAFYGGRKMTPEEVFAAVEQLSPNGGLVEITGGEPMLQEREVVPLMRQLVEGGYQVLLETSGERPLDRVPAGVIKIVDVKCPNSGEPDTFRLLRFAGGWVRPGHRSLRYWRYNRPRCHRCKLRSHFRRLAFQPVGNFPGALRPLAALLRQAG